MLKRMYLAYGKFYNNAYNISNKKRQYQNLLYDKNKSILSADIHFGPIIKFKDTFFISPSCHIDKL